MKRVIAVAVLAVLLVGCASVSTTRNFNGLKVSDPTATPVAHLNGDIWTIYFLPSLRLVPAVDSDGNTYFVDLDDGVGLVTKKAASMGASRVTDLQSHMTSFMIFPPFLLWYKDVEISANALR